MRFLSKHTDEYILTYRKSTGIKHDVHPTWYQICEEQTKDEVIKILKKHLYEPGEYTLHFYAFDGCILRKTGQNFFSGWVTVKTDRVPEGVLAVGSIKFDYYDDTFELCDFKHNWPLIDCEEALTNPTAKFTVAEENLTPSPKEFDIICEKSAERFLKRLHRSVDFPLEIACDYPDVIFEICYDQKPDNELRSKTLKVIEGYAEKYNKTHDEGIHYVAEASFLFKEKRKKKKENAVYVHIDFGNCNIEVLAAVLKALAKSDLAIKKITLK